MCCHGDGSGVLHVREICGPWYNKNLSLLSEAVLHKLFTDASITKHYMSTMSSYIITFLCITMQTDI